jgi:RNA polymerase sigma-70 factor (ECF subfamily)
MNQSQSSALSSAAELLSRSHPADGVNLINLVSFERNHSAASGLRTIRMASNSESQQLPASAADQEKTEETKALLSCMDLVAAKRDRAAFLKIFKHFAPKVKGFLVGRGLNQSTADDVLQEVMLAVWQKAENYSSAKAGLSTWIFTIARYKYIDRLRHDGRRKTEQDEPDLRASDTPVSDDEVFQEQRKDAVQEAISRLPEDQQSVIFLSFIKGLSHSEIAEQLGQPLGTVKSRIRRAFGQLREELGELL